MSEDKTVETPYQFATRQFGRLKLPPVELDLRPGTSGKVLDVYDRFRRQWVALTPEEWVRQHFVHYLVAAGAFSPYRIANEISLTLNGTLRRADTVVYDDSLKPFVVVEYKAPGIALTADVLNQALRYNLVFNAPYVVITNGLDVFTVHDGELSHGLL